MKKNTVTIFAVTYNEEYMLEMFIKHYKSQFADKEVNFVFYDNFSTDTSRAIMMRHRATIKDHDTNNQINDELLLSRKSNCWKGCDSEWVIVCDVDEFLEIDFDYSPYSTIKTKGYNMLRNTRYGVFSSLYSKSIMFRPNEIKEINYAVGCHSCEPEGNIIWPDRFALLLHRPYQSPEYVLNRRKLFALRLSELNKQNKWGIHYQNATKIKTDKIFSALEKNKVNVDDQSRDPTPVSLLISTYNWPEALELCILSVLNQSVLPGEILIADDGSKEETKKRIQQLRKKTSIPIRHFWHDDIGFRKTIILNEAVRHSRFDYIIQTDGDILLHPQFIEEHLKNAKEGFYLRGSRTLIDEETTNELLKKKQFQLKWRSKGIRNRLNAIHHIILSKVFMQFNNPTSIEGVKGCNFSFWKKDFVAVNGFNTEIIGWGREDSELAIRLINNRVYKQHLKFQAVCFHLHHTIFSRDRDERNMKMLKAAIENKIVWAEQGYESINNVIEI
jgi:glycosyltransferase involved in cell wall biosynthesis